MMSLTGEPLKGTPVSDGTLPHHKTLKGMNPLLHTFFALWRLAHEFVALDHEIATHARKRWEAAHLLSLTHQVPKGSRQIAHAAAYSPYGEAIMNLSQSTECS